MSIPALSCFLRVFHDGAVRRFLEGHKDAIHSNVECVLSHSFSINFFVIDFEMVSLFKALIILELTVEQAGLEPTEICPLPSVSWG